MAHTRKRSVFRVISVFVFTLATIVSSCNYNDVVANITDITPTPVTPSPTPRLCPKIVFDPASGLKVTRTLLVILFDEDATENQQVLEFVSGKRTHDVARFIDDLLPKVLGPGDEYSIFELGYRTYEGARYGRHSARISEAPDIFPTPVSHETLTPVATPAIAEGTPGLVIIQQRNQYGTAVANQQATSTQLAFEDLCEVNAYATAYHSTNVAWTVTNQAVSIEIATSVVRSTANAPDPIETPFAENVVYEGISHASIDFKSLCSQYDKCVLLIIDNLIDWRNTRPDNKIPDYLEFNLKNVQVIAVIPTCKDLNAPSCTRLQDLWTDEFILFGSKNPVIYLNGNRLEERLLQLIGDN